MGLAGGRGREIEDALQIGGVEMADHGDVPFSGPETIEALTEERLHLWHAFTNAMTVAVVFVVLLLLGMGIFLL